MASGFDATAFSTGLLGNLNNQAAAQQKQLQEGQLAEYQNFQDAAKEYQQSKNKAADGKNKIDALAGMLDDGTMPSDQSAPMRYATARDAVELGYTNPEHLPLVQEAYKRTLADAVKNPDKWNIDPNAVAQPNQPTQDTNPANTAILQRFNPKLSVQDIENTRQHNVPQPYAALPHASLPNILDFENKAVTAKQQAEQAGKNKDIDAMLPPMPVDSSSTPDSAPPGSSQTPAATPGASSNDISVPASALSPDATQPPTSVTPQTPPTPADGSIGVSGSANQGAVGQQMANLTSASTNTTPNQEVHTQGTITSKGFNENVLAGLPKSTANLVRSVADGNIEPTGSTSPFARDPKAQERFMQYVIAFDPSYSKGEPTARSKMVTSFTSGVDGQSLSAAATATDHLARLAKLAATLNNGPVPAANWVGNHIASGVAGSGRQAEFDQQADILAHELARAYKGSNVSDSDVDTFRDMFSAKMSPDQLNKNIAGQAQALDAKVAESRNRYAKVMGDQRAQNFEFLPPGAQKTLGVLSKLDNSANARSNSLGMEQVGSPDVMNAETNNAAAMPSQIQPGQSMAPAVSPPEQPQQGGLKMTIHPGAEQQPQIPVVHSVDDLKALPPPQPGKPTVFRDPYTGKLKVLKVPEPQDNGNGQ